MRTNLAGCRLSLDHSLVRDGKVVPTKEALELLQHSNDPQAERWYYLVRAAARGTRRTSAEKHRNLGNQGFEVRHKKKNKPGMDVIHNQE